MSLEYFSCQGSQAELQVPAEGDAADHDNNSVNSDQDGQLEVIFEANDIRRRKSSFVPSTAPRPAHHRQKTQCFVHTLLEKHDGIAQRDHSVSYEGLAQERMLDKDPHNHAEESHHSRLLTKNQISDMAFGIRELSKKLAQIRIRLHVRNIFILAKAHDETLIKHTRETTDWLLTKNETYKVYVEDTLEHNKLFDAKGLLEKNPSYEGRLRFWTNELCQNKPQTFDIVLALGGDGTVLYSSWLFQRIVPPVLAFSLGSLGFLTKFDYEKYPFTLSRAFDEGITVSLRLRFEATIMRSQNRDNDKRDLVEELIGEESEDHHTHRPDGTHNILNEVVVDRGPNPTMSSIELFGDDEHFTTVQADGICVSTPTGSTAYNLAAGGSLCHPDNPVILVTAICAHTLSFRPIILPDTIVLRTGVPYDARTSSWASFDGRERVELKPGDYVTISASRFPFPSVLPLDRKSKDWIDSISRTLQWGPTEEKPDKKLPPEVKTTEEAPTSVGVHAGGCSECDMDGTEGCLVDSAFTLEVPHTRVAHDKESFVKFLHRLPLSEVKVISRMSHLCKLAYAIQEIKPSDLLENHDLSFVTSSLDQKAEALAREQAADKSSGCQRAECSQKFPINPASAYALASAVASYLHSHTRALLQLKRQCDSENKAQPENDDQKGATAPVRSTVEDAKGSVPDYNSEEVASMIASSPMTAVVAAKDGARDAVAKDLQSLHSCPCEWYCCDDKQSLTRYFVIQGSESLASWQANLLFEPTFFEDPNLGVFVHRGIYEAAKGLYQQVLPHVLEHLKEHGESARLCFTGHSLGGSLSTLVSLMLRIRGVVQPSTLLPVYTFGSPCTMCGGDFLLNKLGLPRTQVRSVMLHRDIVPRTFACDYPDHVAEVLKRINGSFRDHPCLNNQRLLYAPMGEFLILQPSEQDAPSHPLLPQGQGLYALRHPQTSSTDKKQDIELRAAQRAFLNSPHPLEILSDRTAYGSEGTISRDHDPRSYMKAISNVSREEGKKFRRLRREQRRRLWWPVMAADISSVLDSSSSGDSGSRSNVASSSITSSGFQHTQLVLLGFLSAKLLLTEGLATFFTWI